MMNVCVNCGLYRVDKVIDLAGPYAICPDCGHPHPFRQLPLLIVSGASGAGKSTACYHLLGRLTEVVLLDSDILWRPEFNRPETQHRDFFETWLRVAKNISQAGRPVVLFGAGVGVPDTIEPCVERRYFSDVHYLGLVCSDETLIGRLQRRPEWRQSGNRSYIEEHLHFNRWFQERGPDAKPAMELLDTSAVSAQVTAQQVAGWIRAKVADATLPKGMPA
jgi:hypothetical protein